MRVALLALLCCAAFAEDDLTADAKAFVEKHSTADDGKAWAKWWAEKSAQTAKDFDLAGEEEASDRYLTGWLRDRVGAFTKDPKSISVKDKVTLCRFYLMYKAKGWMIPERVAEHITKKKYDEVFAEEKQ